MAELTRNGSISRAELEIRLRQQALLAEIGHRALIDPGFEVLLTEATRLTALGLQTRYCKILEYLPEQNRLLVRAGVGWQEGVVGHATIGADLASPAGYALHTGKPVISNQLSEEERFRTPPLLSEHGVRRAINVILLGAGHPYGVLEADSEEPGAFTEHDIDFMQGVANLLGVALERRRADEALRRLNETLEQRVEDAIRQRRQVEDTLRQAQKMEAVGQLTGGVAHDFNNLLQIITGNLELISRAVAGDERLERLVATAQKGALRGAQLTSQLLAFARRQALNPEIRPINDLLRELNLLTSKMLSEAIDVDFQLDPTAGACRVDPAQFGSALLNLIVNSRDAMPNGGNVTIRTENITLDAAAASLYADALPRNYVMVEVADTGAGMSPEVLERATEPFFTTKEPGKGTGLGLSQVYGFVRQSDGFLALRSTPGKGTAVRIHLPLVAPTTMHEGPSAAAEPGVGTVLVVEDDPDVRDLVLAYLEDLGYATLAASDGPDALAQLDANGDLPIDLLLTDMIMPGGMSGLDLVGEAQKRRPGLKVVLTSGYVAGGLPPTTSSAIETAGFPLLSKPYAQVELARVIRQVMHQEAAE